MIETDQLRGMSLDDLRAATETIAAQTAHTWQIAGVSISTRNNELIYRVAIELMALEQVRAQIVEAIKEKTV